MCEPGKRGAQVRKREAPAAPGHRGRRKLPCRDCTRALWGVRLGVWRLASVAVLAKPVQPVGAYCDTNFYCDNMSFQKHYR